MSIPEIYVKSGEMHPIELEIQIRGKICYLFSIIENCLARIILFTDRNDTDFKFKNMMLKQKADFAINVIKTDYPTTYAHYEVTFNSLLNIVNFRNQIVHCKFNWDSRDLSKFSLWDVQVDSHKLHNFVEVHFTIDELNQKIDEIVVIGNVLLPLTNFFVDLMNAYLRENPNLAKPHG